MNLTPTSVRSFLNDYLNRKLIATGRPVCDNLTEECDLLLSGMIDSIGLLELMAAIQDFYGRDIDFDAIDPEEMTIVGPLCEFVSQQIGIEP
jgi:acyl carrier protein